MWVEKYRPRTVEDCILPKTIKDTFNGIVRSGEIPNLLLSGPAGTGKTTIAKAICNELGLLENNMLFINASKERGIDTIRTTVTKFSSTKSFDGKRKVVLLDEADSLTPDAQTALRALIEEFSSNTSFIFTCNFKNRIIKPLHSRTTVIEFKPKNKEDKLELIKGLYRRVVQILSNEDVEYNKDVLQKVLIKYFPDNRQLIQDLQTYTKAYGKIDEGLLSYDKEIDLSGLFKALKNKDYKEVRNWVVNSLDNDPNILYRKIYDNLKDALKNTSIPQAVILIADYQYKNSFSADSEICFLAFLTELMVHCEFK
jgi:DNA polymerase III delta prime subunit